MSFKKINFIDIAIFRLTKEIEGYLSYYASIQNDNYSGIESLINFISKFLENEDPSMLKSDHYSRNSIAPTPELCFVAIYKMEIVGMTYHNYYCKV